MLFITIHEDTYIQEVPSLSAKAEGLDILRACAQVHWQELYDEAGYNGGFLGR